MSRVTEYNDSWPGYSQEWKRKREPDWYDIYGDDVGYWNVGIKLAKSNSTLISRWQNQFKSELLLQAKKVLKTKTSEFIPDIQEVQKDIDEDQEIEDALWEEELCYCYD